MSNEIEQQQEMKPELKPRQATTPIRTDQRGYGTIHATHVRPHPVSVSPAPSPPARFLRAHKPQRAVNFICAAPQAKSVSLVGDFNAWNPATHPMQQMPDRSWLLRVELKHGHHRYAFMVDGQLVLDPKAQGFARNDQGQRVSLLPVS